MGADRTAFATSRRSSTVRASPIARLTAALTSATVYRLGATEAVAPPPPPLALFR